MFRIKVLPRTYFLRYKYFIQDKSTPLWCYFESERYYSCTRLECSLLKGNFFKEIQYNSILEGLNIFERVVLKEIFYFCKSIVEFSKMAHHVSFEVIETYLHKNNYPSYIIGNKSKKANFRKTCKSFHMLHGQLIYSNTRLVISSTERQDTIINNIHKGLEHVLKVKAMASHCGRNSTIQKISNRFFWHNIKGDVKEFIKKCHQCQKQREV